MNRRVALLVTVAIAASCSTTSAQVPGPQGPGGLPKPTTQAAWVAAVQAALTRCYIAQFDPSTTITIATPVVLTATDCGQQPRGLNGNGMSITSMINNGADVITLTTSSASRGLVFGNFHVFGGTYSGLASGNCLSIVAAKNRPIYKGTFANIYTDSCGKNGVSIVGDVYESLVDNIQSENNNGDGLFTNSGADGGVLSNLIVRSPNLSRNQGYGLHHGSPGGSLDIVAGGSFINNWLGGVLCENGCRTVENINCENSGPICVSMPWSAYPVRISGVNATSDGGVKGTSAASGVLKYTILYHGPATNLIGGTNAPQTPTNIGGWAQGTNYITPEGNNTSANIAVFAP
jgi:hypothetical protein